MPRGPAVKRPLPTVLAELAFEKRGLVLAQGRTYFRIEDQASQARREAKSGPSETRRFLQAHDFWWDEDPDGLVVVYQDTPGGPKPLAAEIGSRFTPLALDEGDWGPEMILSGSLGPVGVRDPFMSGRKLKKDPKHQDLREGYWRMLQRIHRGIPGLKGTGTVNNGQFTGGAAGVQTAWVLKPHGSMSMIDAIPVAGFYSFGAYWPHMLQLMGLPDNANNILRDLDAEFGIASDRDLTRGTVPNPEASGSMGKPVAAEAGMKSGPQFETVVEGTPFRIVYTKHFVDRFTYDEGSRPAVSRFMDPEMIREEIEKALPEVRKILLDDPYAEGIIISKPYGLSLKFIPVAQDDGFLLRFVTQIIVLPLWRTSDREVEIVLNPVVPVEFEEMVPEDIQLAVLGDLGPEFMVLGPGESELMTGEIVSALITHGPEGFTVADAAWKENLEPLSV